MKKLLFAVLLTFAWAAPSFAQLNFPYKWRITSIVDDGAGTGWAISITILDGLNTVRGTVIVYAGKLETYQAIEGNIREQVRVQMEADAGGRLQLLTELLGRNIQL